MTGTVEKRDATSLKTLDSFLDEDGVLEEVTANAIKRVIAHQLLVAMEVESLTKSAMAERMRTSRAQLARVLDPTDFNVTLETLSRAARAVGRKLKVALV